MVSPRDIKWVFFDIGGPLLDDTPLRRAQYEAALEYYLEKGVVGSREEFEELLEKLSKKKGSKPRMLVAMLAGSEEEARRDYEAIKERVRRRMRDISSLYKPQPGIREVLDLLNKRGYDLGIISNYDSWIKGVLEEHGLLGYFSVVVLAGEVGYKKPQPEIFYRALELAGSTPGESAMVGDRVDTDIAPAKRLGFYTIRMVTGEHAREEPSGPDEEPHATVRFPREILGVLGVGE